MKLIRSVLVLPFIMTLVACGGAENAAAEAAYEACVRSEAENGPLVQLNRNTVSVELKGDSARAVSQSDGAVDNLERDGEFKDGDVEGLVLGMVFLLDTECLVEATGYPGSASQLQDGDEWEGWRFSEETGPGSEHVVKFTATS